MLVAFTRMQVATRCFSSLVVSVILISPVLRCQYTPLTSNWSGGKSTVASFLHRELTCELQWLGTTFISPEVVKTSMKSYLGIHPPNPGIWLEPLLLGEVIMQLLPC